MPIKPGRPCRYRNCSALTTDKSGLCEQHKKLEQQHADQERGTSTERGYNSRWARYSRLYRLEHPLCVICEAEGRITASEHVDHIKPVSGPGDPLFWLESNHQALCGHCHRVKTAKEDGAFGNRLKE